MLFHERLKEARKRAGLTQSDVSDALGIASSTVSGYELGTREPTIETLIRLINLYGVDGNYMFQDGVSGFVLSDYEHKLIHATRSLDDTGKKNLLAYAESLALVQEVDRSLVSPDSQKDTA